MKTFLVKAGIYIIVVIFFVLTLLKWKGEEFIGHHYARFATPKQYSLVCGTSMAAQDIVPQVIDSCLNDKFKGPLYNYSFAINSSPWGSCYKKSILKKVHLNPQKTSLFILGVDPFSLGFFLGDSESGARREASGVIGKMQCVTGCAGMNFEHLFRYELMDKNFFRLHSWRGNHIDKSGRYISLLSETEDTMSVHLRFYGDVLPDYYQNYIPGYRPSPERMGDLSTLIDWLSLSGRVFLVRFPVRKEIDRIMDSVWTGFDPTIAQLASEKGCHYINFRDNTTYKTTDGTHLYSSEAFRFSHALADSIKTYWQ